MIPRTFLSTYAVSGQQQMVVVFLDNITGLTRWVDYIPVKFAAGTKVNSYDNDGFILVDAITPSGTDVPFKEYIPVYNDISATDAWTVNAVGYIPYSPEYSPYNPLDPTLDLWFSDMDTSYTAGDTVDLNFISQTYESWQLPSEPQGSYRIWVGDPAWEPGLNLDFVNQIYQQAS